MSRTHHGVAQWTTSAKAVTWLLVIAGVFCQNATSEPIPPPTGDVLDAATAAVTSIYSLQVKQARTAADRTALAHEIFKNHKSAAKPAERYALGMTALDLASRSDDPLLVVAICDELATHFKVDRLGLCTRNIGTTSGPIDALAWPLLKAKMKGLFDDCLHADRFEEAEQVVSVLMQFAKRARDLSMNAAVASLRKSLRDRRQQWDRYTQLATAANASNADTAANLEFGRLLCFERKDWRQGIKYLARTDDPMLAAPAALEVAATTSEQKLVAADAWAKNANSLLLNDREMARDHAVALFEEVAAASNGLTKIRAQKGLDAVLEAGRSGDRDSVRTKWTVIFCAPTPDVWNTDTEESQTNYARSLSNLPPSIRFVRLRRLNGECVILQVDRKDLGAEVAAQQFGWNGTNLEFAGARMLGISDRRTDVDKKTGVVAVSRHGGLFTGWGFGHRIHHGGAAELCWGGKWIPREPLEIAVIARQLTAAEERCLLR